MNSACKIWQTRNTTVLVALTALFCSPSHLEAAFNPEIAIRVYNYANVPQDTLAKGEAGAAMILREAGLETLWLDCPLPADGRREQAACHQPLRPTEMVLRLLPSSNGARAESPHPVLGSTLIAAEGKPSVYASVHCQAIEYLAKRRDVEVFQLFTIAMAHEIGHLLLNSNTHSITGIMRAEWSREDLQRATRGQLLFAPQQCKLMRAQALARLVGHAHAPATQLFQDAVMANVLADHGR